MNFKKELASILHELLDQEISLTELELMIEKPKNTSRGDLAFPCFTLAKLKRKAPNAIAQDLSEKIQSATFENVEVVGAYLNIFLNKKLVSEKLVKEVLAQEENFASQDFGGGGTITIDMSSPNIAKPF